MLILFSELSPSTPKDEQIRKKLLKSEIQSLSQTIKLSPKCQNKPPGLQNSVELSDSQDLFHSPAQNPELHAKSSAIDCIEPVHKPAAVSTLPGEGQKSPKSVTRVSLSMSKYKNRNFIGNQANSSKTINGNVENLNGEKIGLNSVCWEKLVNKDLKVTKAQSFDNAQVVVFERQTSSLVKSSTNKNNVDERSHKPGSETDKMEDTSKRTVMKEIKSNLLEQEKAVLNIGNALKENLIQDIEQTLVEKEHNKLSSLASASGHNKNLRRHSLGASTIGTINPSRSRKRRFSGYGDDDVQRRSSRIAEQTSQDLSEENPEVTSPFYESVRGSLTRVRRRSGLFGTASSWKSKKCVLVTSMFQCLVDEGKRKNTPEDFSLPDEFLDLCQISTEHVLDDCAENIVETKSRQCDNDECSDLNEVKSTRNSTAEHSPKIVSSPKSSGDPDASKTADLNSFLQPNTHSEVLEPADLSISRPCDNCVSANSSKTEALSPTLFDSQSDQLFAFNEDPLKCGTHQTERNLMVSEQVSVTGENRCCGKVLDTEMPSEIDGAGIGGIIGDGCDLSVTEKKHESDNQKIEKESPHYLKQAAVFQVDMVDFGVW